MRKILAAAVAVAPAASLRDVPRQGGKTGTALAEKGSDVKTAPPPSDKDTDKKSDPKTAPAKEKDAKTTEK
jgi:hypothetical protein